MLEISKSEFSAALEELDSALAYIGIACSQCQMSEQDVRMCSRPVKLWTNCAQRRDNFHGFVYPQLVTMQMGFKWPPQLYCPTAAGHHAGQYPWALVARAIPTSLLPFPRRWRLNSWASSPGPSAEMTLPGLPRTGIRDGGQGQTGRMQKDQAAPSKMQQKEHLPQPQLPASPGQAPWGPLPQQQWSWGSQCIRGVPSPLAHRNRVLGTIPSLEQTTTPVSMRVAEAKEGVQTQLPHCPWQPWCQTSSCPCWHKCK